MSFERYAVKAYEAAPLDADWTVRIDSLFEAVGWIQLVVVFVAWPPQLACVDYCSCSVLSLALTPIPPLHRTHHPSPARTITHTHHFTSTNLPLLHHTSLNNHPSPGLSPQSTSPFRTTTLASGLAIIRLWN